MKRCAACGETKALDAFHRNQAQNDGRATRCRSCRSADSKAASAAREVSPLDYPNPERLRPVTDAECAYLAGIIDGEGWVGAGRNRQIIEARVSIANTDGRLLRWVAARWPCTVNWRERQPPERNYGSATATNRKVVPMLADALPYLVLKTEQAHLVLELATSSRNYGRRGYPPEVAARRLAIGDQLNDLNRKGPR